MKPLLLDTNILIKFLRGDGKIGEVISRYERILAQVAADVVRGCAARSAVRTLYKGRHAPRLRDLLDRGRTVIESMPPTYKAITRR